MKYSWRFCIIILTFIWVLLENRPGFLDGVNSKERWDMVNLFRVLQAIFSFTFWSDVFWIVYDERSSRGLLAMARSAFSYYNRSWAIEMLFRDWENVPILIKHELGFVLLDMRSDFYEVKIKTFLPIYYRNILPNSMELFGGVILKGNIRQMRIALDVITRCLSDNLKNKSLCVSSQLAHLILIDCFKGQQIRGNGRYWLERVRDEHASRCSACNRELPILTLLCQEIELLSVN